MSRIVLFVLLTFLLFYPYFTAQKAPIALDIPIGMYYPWYNHTYGYAVRPPVKNPILTDTVSQFWIWRNRAVLNLKSGQEVTWNPYSLSGYNMSSWFHTILYSPLNIYYYFFSVVDAMSLVVITQVFISLLGTFLFAKTIFKSNLTGMFVSVSWSLTSYFVGWLTWGTVSFALSLLPVILYFWEKSHNGDNRRLYRVGALLSLISLILSGHPQTTAYMFLVLIAWAAYKLRSLKAVMDIFLATLVCLPLIFPSFDIIRNSIRSLENLSNVNNGFIPWPKILATLLTPNFFGNPATNNYFGADYNFQEKLVYFGVLPLIFSTYVFVRQYYKNNASKLIKLALFYILVGLLVSTELPFGWIIYYLKLPIISTSPAGRGFIIAIFGFILLSGIGFSDLEKNKIHIKSIIFSVLIWLFSLTVSVFILLFTLRFIKESPESLHVVYQSIKINGTITLRNLAYPFIFISGLAIFLFASKIRSLKYISLILIIALALSDSYLFFKKYTPFVPKNLIFPSTPAIDFLTKQSKNSPDLFRIERESAEILPPNMWEVFGLQSASGYDPMAPKSYENYLVSHKALSGHSRYVENAQVVDKIDSLGIKYLLVLKRNPQGVVDVGGKIPHYINQKKWQEVYYEGPVSVLENKQYQKPYFLESSASGEIKLITQSDNSFHFQINTPQRTKFIFMENYDSGWSVKVSGVPTSIEKYQDTFISVQLSSGKNDVILTHSSSSVNINYKLAIVIFVLTIAYIIVFS